MGNGIDETARAIQGADGEWYVRSAEGLVYGPADTATLVTWAEEGRIEPTGFVSRDRKDWVPAQLMECLAMSWVVEAQPGKFYGPFNRAFVVKLAAGGSIPEGANIYRRHDLPPDRDPEPVVVEKIVERIIEVEPPPRRAIHGGEKDRAAGGRPPAADSSGLFGGAAGKLAALEDAARRELAAWNKMMGK